jgi:hypothetical protein
VFRRYSKTRNDKPEQQWYLKDGATKIQLANSTFCMDGGASSERHHSREHETILTLRK